MSFISTIEQAIRQHPLPQLKQEVWARWGDYLFASDIEKPDQLTDFQVGFLMLLSQKYETLISPLIEDRVKETLDNFYEDLDTYQEIMLHGISMTDLTSGQWSITFEDDNRDVIVGFDMKEWAVVELFVVH